MTTDAAKFSVLWEDQGSQDKHAMHITGFGGERAPDALRSTSARRA